MISLLDTKEKTVIFANVEDILLTNTVCFLCVDFSMQTQGHASADFPQLIRGTPKAMSLVY